MMIELARELRKEEIVRLGKIAKITHLSEKYLAQLAIPLKKAGLIVGVSGKKGGYHLGRNPGEIKVGEIVDSLTGKFYLTDCVNSPEICLNCSFCEARIIWTILSGRISEFLDGITLADMIDKDYVKDIRKEYAHLPLLNPDQILAETDINIRGACPSGRNKSINRPDNNAI